MRFAKSLARSPFREQNFAQTRDQNGEMFRISA
jgi:hypothetical protein